MDATAGLQQFFVWLTTSGGAVALVSFISERVPVFQELPSSKKLAVQLTLSVVVALLAWAGMKYIPTEVIEFLAEPFAIVAGIVAVFVGANQGFHTVSKKLSGESKGDG